MTAKEALDKIRELFGTTGHPAAATTTDYKTTDGKTITCEGAQTPEDGIKAGTKVVLTDATGKAPPLPDGDYTLENGTVITTAAGVITNVTAPAKTDAQTTTSNPPTSNFQLQSDLAEIKKQLLARDEKFEAAQKENIVLKESLDKITAMLEDYKKSSDEFKASVQEGFKLVETIATGPAAAPAEPVKNRFKKDNEQFDKKILCMAETITKIRTA